MKKEKNYCCQEHCYHQHSHHHHHHKEINSKSIKYLFYSFLINIFLSIIELIAGILSKSVALIGDSLHNTSDALSILIAIIAYKIGLKKSNKNYTFGFKRAEIIGGFVNLILLLISSCYLFFDGIKRLFFPENINGYLIIYVSVLALIIDIITVKISHQDSKHNKNIKILFLHNLADALGSVGVIISGLFIVYFNWSFVDGIIALLIAFYMFFHAIAELPDFIRILMNATPNNIDIDQIEKEILKLKDVKNIHHIHIWNNSEDQTFLECHIVSENFNIIKDIEKVLFDKFKIIHTNIQIENEECSCKKCVL